jgi:hypothetical protein
MKATYRLIASRGAHQAAAMKTHRYGTNGATHLHDAFVHHFWDVKSRRKKGDRAITYTRTHGPAKRIKDVLKIQTIRQDITPTAFLTRGQPTEEETMGMMRCSFFFTILVLLYPQPSSSALRSKNRNLAVKQYKLLSSAEIHETLQKWATDTDYTNFLQLTTSQSRYGLSRAGGANDCPFEEGNGCSNFVLTIQNFVAHPEGSDSSNRLPEVFWSGTLHGDERVGPTAVVEASYILLRAASCQELGGEEANVCRLEFAGMGISVEQQQWLARLVSTRRIVVVPTANALGYFQNRREEGRIDPNRDFPYDRKGGDVSCMESIAARTLNEVFREHMFQLALTFHSGVELIGYEWGAPEYLKDTSPDDISQAEIAAAYSDFAGSWSSTKLYRYGAMNDVIYPVNGAMEDWGYAASWDTDNVVQCNPTQFGG